MAATCTEAGKAAGHHCSRCDYTDGGEVVAALGHTEEVVPAVAATYDATGLTEGKKCSVCGEILVAQEATPKLQYTITIAVEHGTVTTNGQTVESMPVDKGTPASELSSLTVTPDEHYHFVKWQMLYEGNYIDIPNDATVQSNLTVRPLIEIDTFKVTWKNEDGTVLEEDENVVFGTKPSFEGAMPTKAKDENYTYEFSGWDKELADVSDNVTYTAKYNATLNWLLDNNISVNRILKATPELSFEMEAGSFDTGDFPGSGNKSDLPYLAYNGSYGVGTYVMLDFTGDNMPAIEFFKGVVNASFCREGEVDDINTKGITMVSGIRDNTGESWSGKVWGGVQSDTPMDRQISLIGFYGLGFIAGSTQQNFIKDVIAGYGMADLATTYSDTHFRMICGFSQASGNSLQFEFALINLDTNKIACRTSMWFNPVVDPSYYTGNIVVYGTHFKTLKIDKAYLLLDGAQMDAEINKFASEEVKKIDNIDLHKALSNNEGEVTLLRGTNNYGWDSTLLGQDATHDFAYVGYNGSYGVNDFVVVDFTGENMPVIEFNKPVLNGSYYYNSELQDLSNNTGYVLINGFRNKIRIDEDWSDALRLVGWKGIYNIGFNDSNGPEIQRRHIVLTDKFGILDLSGDELKNTHFRMICGFTENSFEWIIINLDTNEVLESISCPIVNDLAEGKIALYGALNKDIKLDKVYPVEENTTIELVKSKYISQFKDNAPKLVNSQVELNVSDYVSSESFKLSVKSSSGVMEITDSTFTLPSDGEYTLVLEENGKAKAELALVANKFIVESNISTYKGTWDYDKQSVVLEECTNDQTIGRAVDMNCQNDQTYIAYNGNYGIGDYVVVDFTGDNMPIFSFFTAHVCNSMLKVDGQDDMTYNKRLIVTNGWRNSDGTNVSDYDGNRNKWIRSHGPYGLIHVESGGVIDWNHALDYGITKLQSVSDHKFRMIIGYSNVTDEGSLTCDIWIYDLTDGQTVVDYSNSQDWEFPDGYFNGSIQLFGAYGKTITLDKVYAIEEDTTMSALKTKYTPAA